MSNLEEHEREQAGITAMYERDNANKPKAEWRHPYGEDPTSRTRINGRTFIAAHDGSFFQPMVWDTANKEWKPLLNFSARMSQNEAETFCETAAAIAKETTL